MELVRKKKVLEAAYELKLCAHNLYGMARLKLRMTRLKLEEEDIFEMARKFLKWIPSDNKFKSIKRDNKENLKVENEILQ